MRRIFLKKSCKRFAKPEKVRTFAIPKRSGLADETAALELREKIIEKTGD
ncbi:MAG: hypothetical protein SPK08_00855 [Candidatus Cryptobacteroides sp.]|nr:hypothetical protein [Rikenellaceae bacterium]MDY5746079.1 hypothetical protein [Candidatus Cryptobacteroides sp.]